MRAVALLAVAAAFASAATAQAGKAKGRPLKGEATLSLPPGGPDADATGVLDVKFFPAVGKRPERSWIRLKLKRLDPNAEFTIWADDPSTPATDLVQIPSASPVVSNDSGVVQLKLDTKHAAGAMPFGASLADLAGKPIEVRDAAGVAVVLEGSFPTLR